MSVVFEWFMQQPNFLSYILISFISECELLLHLPSLLLYNHVKNILYQYTIWFYSYIEIRI